MNYQVLKVRQSKIKTKIRNDIEYPFMQETFYSNWLSDQNEYAKRVTHS